MRVFGRGLSTRLNIFKNESFRKSLDPPAGDTSWVGRFFWDRSKDSPPFGNACVTSNLLSEKSLVGPLATIGIQRGARTGVQQAKCLNFTARYKFYQTFLFSTWRRWFFLLIFNAYIFIRMNLLVCYVYFHYMNNRHTHISHIHIFKTNVNRSMGCWTFHPLPGEAFLAQNYSE